MDEKKIYKAKAIHFSIFHQYIYKYFSSTYL